jgi:hypothetical protein
MLYCKYFCHSKYHPNFLLEATCSSRAVVCRFRCTILLQASNCSRYFLIIKPTRCTNFSNLFWNETLHVSDSSSVHHQERLCIFLHSVPHSVPHTRTTGLNKKCRHNTENISNDTHVGTRYVILAKHQL